MGRAESLHRRATEDLDFIRRTMERASAFTAVPGLGLVAVGATALFATPLAAGAASATGWLTIWLGCALVAATIGIATMVVKARRAGVALLDLPGRRFLIALALPFAAALLLTVVLARAGRGDLLPSLWLVLYGVGVCGGGAFTIRPVVVMGGCFFALGAIVAFVPALPGDVAMALGFGMIHVLFGVFIARRHGG